MVAIHLNGCFTVACGEHEDSAATVQRITQQIAAAMDENPVDSGARSMTVQLSSREGGSARLLVECNFQTRYGDVSEHLAKATAVLNTVSIRRTTATVHYDDDDEAEVIGIASTERERELAVLESRLDALLEHIPESSKRDALRVVALSGYEDLTGLPAPGLVIKQSEGRIDSIKSSLPIDIFDIEAGHSTDVVHVAKLQSEVSARSVVIAQRMSAAAHDSGFVQQTHAGEWVAHSEGEERLQTHAQAAP